jgi:photosystem II stability/assembly factor-like uncharacterized protein
VTSPPHADFLDGVSCATTLDGVATGFVGGSFDADILASTDGGVTWTEEYANRALADDPWTGVSCPTALDCWVSARKSSGGPPTGGVVLATTDGGKNWVSDSLPGGTLVVSDVSCPSSGECWALGRTSAVGPLQLMTTSNGGSTWSFAPAAIEGGETSVACPSVSTCYATAGPETVVTTRDASGTACTGSAAGGALVGIAAMPDGGGYWLASAAGGLVACGDAPFDGSPVSERIPLFAPIVGIAATVKGCGYWLLARDATVYPFGPCALRLPRVRSGAPSWASPATPPPPATGSCRPTAESSRSTPPTEDRSQAPAFAPTTSSASPPARRAAGTGRPGRTEACSASAFDNFGSLPGLGMQVRDIVAIDRTVSGPGYLLSGAGGAAYVLGSGTAFCGSESGQTSAPVSASATYGFSPGYWLLERNGRLDLFDAPFDGTSVAEAGRPGACG